MESDLNAKVNLMNRLCKMTSYFVCFILVSSAGTAVCQDQKKSDDNQEDIVREIVVSPRSGDAGAQGEVKQVEDVPEQYHVQHIAAPEPVPALKYRLYPSRGELVSGNSVPYYYRAIHQWASRTTEQKQEFTEVHELTWDRPLADLLEPELHERLRQATITYAFENIKAAAYRDQTNWDWQVERLRGGHLFAFLLSEIQDARGLSRLIDVKTRLLAAEGKLDEALELHKQHFKMASDIAEPPFLINNLVGIAQTSISLAVILDTICQTDCPNLYWALASMPDPLIPMRTSLEFETSFPETMFPFLKDPEHDEHAPREWSRLLREVAATVQSLDDDIAPGWLKSQFWGSGLLVRAYPIAKRELVSAGWDRDKIESMPVGQVVAIYQKRVMQIMSQNLLKWQYHPSSRVSESEQEAIQELGQARRRWREPIPLVAVFMPAVMQAKSAETRLQSKIKGLMVLEAIRMHAAVNNGKLPKSLDEIAIVPVPEKCPTTGEPYKYNYANGNASLVVPWAKNQKFLWWEFHLKSKP